MQLEEIEKTEIDQLLNIMLAKQTILYHLHTNNDYCKITSDGMDFQFTKALKKTH